MDSKNVLKFIEKLTENNNREWFTANKEWYLEVKNEVDKFTKLWLERLVELEPEVADLEPKECVYRIYRDIRFSPNKVPYKHWMGVYVAKRGGRKSPYGGYYLHLQPGNCLFAGGIWCPEPDLLKALRQDVYDNAEELEEIFARPEVKPYLTDFDTDYMLKTVPASFRQQNPDFDPEWPHADWLKRKTFTFSYPLQEKELEKPDFIEKLMTLCRAGKPINDFLNYTVENL